MNSLYRFSFPFFGGFTLISAFDNIDSDTGRSSRSDITICTRCGLDRPRCNSQVTEASQLIDSWINTLKKAFDSNSFAYNRPVTAELLLRFLAILRKYSKQTAPDIATTCLYAV